jgi:hypothetical protein
MLTAPRPRHLILLTLWLSLLHSQAAQALVGQPSKPLQRDSLLQVSVSIEQHTLQLEVAHPSATFVMVEVYNAAGYRVYEQMLPLQDGKDRVQLNLGSLADGPVLVRCNTLEKYAPQDVLLHKQDGALTQR